MNALSKLPNIGIVLEKQLNEVGISTIEDLKQIGAQEAWLKIQQIDSSACLHRLMALEGAIQGVKKTLIDEQKRQELKEFYYQHR
ncbi:MAG: TfoX/Sxy family protein [Faecalibacillus sp.]